MLAGLEMLVERLLHQHFGGELALSAGIACVVEVDLVGPFLAGEDYLVGIDDDDVVAAFNEWRVAGLVFAAKQLGDF